MDAAVDSQDHCGYTHDEDATYRTGHECPEREVEPRTPSTKSFVTHNIDPSQIPA
jgi:hypothetical protein